MKTDLLFCKNNLKIRIIRPTQLNWSMNLGRVTYKPFKHNLDYSSKTYYFSKIQNSKRDVEFSFVTLYMVRDAY